jgi:DNA-directed RNA polymerase specialized sigma24 family protein
VTCTAARAQEIAAFYARYASRLQRIVASKVNAPTQTVEDACQNAWATLLRRDDVTLDHRGAGWLATVAIHEAWRLARCAEVPAGATPPGLSEGRELLGFAVPEPAADEQALAHVEHTERVADLRTLKPRERRELYLQALGYRYSEIAKATGSSYTAINRRLSEGRARLRALERTRNAEDAGDQR